MTKKERALQLPKTKMAAEELPTVEDLQPVFGVGEADLLNQKINEIAKLLWTHEDASQEAKEARVLRALELYESLEPADGAEGMLAIQMVGTHDAALECLKRAALSNQTFEGRDMALKHAHKLMTLYAQQLATLDKHRGKGQQKVTVEHVNVQAGGQAIVGNVEASASQRSSPANKPEVIEHNPEVPLNEPRPRRKSRAKKK